MNGGRKLVWREGMLMLPHHFQQLDLYHERLLHERLAALTPYSWGVAELAVDEQALAGGVFRLLRVSCVLPDGLLIRVGDADPGAPPSRPAEPHLPPNRAGVGVYLAVPAQRETAPNVAEVGAGGGDGVEEAPMLGGGARFVGEVVRVPDLNTGGNEQSILWARQNLALLFDDESLEGYDAIKIAEVVRSPAGKLDLREGYIPPLLRVGASPFIMNGLRKLLALLLARQKALASGRRERGGSGSVEFGAADVQALWMLQALNGVIPTLSYAHNTGEPPPTLIYVELARCAGQLLTFVVDGDPGTIANFNFTDLGTTFGRLFEMLTQLIGAQVTGKYITIPLDQKQPGFYTGRIQDHRLLEAALFYLAIGGDVPEATMRDRIPRLLKVGSFDQISQIISAAMPGVRVELDYRPPGAIPVRAGHIYLRLEKGGAYWDRIRSTGTIAVYQPLEPARLKVELMAVSEGS